jgi:hypothetical protein
MIPAKTATPMPASKWLCAKAMEKTVATRP